MDWRGLLKEVADDVGLDVDQENDLIAVAQHHQNKHMSRAKLDRIVVEAVIRDTTLSENHRLLASLPVDTVWTTNCIFVAGNKLDSASGAVVGANGVSEEFWIASDLGKYPIPIGATGHAARRIWQQVSKDLDSYFPDGGVKGHFKTIGSESSTNEVLVEAVVGVLKQIRAIQS